MGGIGKLVGAAVGGPNIGRYASVASAGMHMQLSHDMMKTIGSIFQHADDRSAFNAILLATVEHVSKKPHFNVQLELNDLWIKLGNLRDDIAKAEAGASAPGGFGGASPFGAIPGMSGATRAMSLSSQIIGVLGKMLQHLDVSKVTR